MKILIITENFYPERNAPSKRLFEHAKFWVKAGNKVTVLTSAPNFPIGKVFNGYKNKLYQSEVIEKIKIIRTWTFIAKNEKFLLRTIDFASFMITSFVFGLFQKKYDKIIVSSPQFLPVISGYLLSKIKGSQFILEIRDLWPESIVDLGAMSEKNLFINLFYKIAFFMYKNSDHIFVVTKSFKKYLINKGINENKITVIENGFNFEKSLTPNLDIDKIELKYALNRNQFILSYIGTIGLAHGLETILETAKNMHDVVFLIIGEGSEKTKLKQIALDEEIKNVIFIDSLKWQEIVNINQIISAHIIHLKDIPLFETVIPSKIFESMALKKPILAGLIGESLKIIEDSCSGLKVIPENYKSLKNKIDFLKKNPNKLDDFGMNGFELVNKKYNRQILAKKMIQKIQNI